ncbi:MAG: phosphoglycerate mutase family protein [Sneathiella sp.]|nr:phosphoglycerate mutase family protein [Sneathiella sp.]
MDITLHLVRHGEAAGSWDSSVDPGLSGVGRLQAQEMARRLNQKVKPVNLFSSPLNRTKETAQPLADIWQREMVIAPNLIEIPSAGVDFGDRRKWLTEVLQGTWTGQSAHLQGWRSNILDFVKKQASDAVFVTHFVVINAIVGAIEESDKVVVFHPDNCSVTKIRLSEGRMSLIEKGTEAVTVVK